MGVRVRIPTTAEIVTDHVGRTELLKNRRDCCIWFRG